MKENLRWRRETYTRAASDAEFQAALTQACSEDVLFWINGFVWTFDPRKPNPKLPFCTWPYQDNAFLALDEAIGEQDVLVEKSRDMGASWICLTTFLWRWMYRSRQAFLMVSRKESLVDGMSDSLFAHMDFIIDGLPVWMVPSYRRNKLKLYNLDNGSKIDGEATVENLGRGGRRTALLVDEFAAFERGGWDVLSATADNTNTRIFNSTPNGTGNAFYAQRQGGTARLRMHWSDHPEKGAGKFQTADGKWHSPWYDREVGRRAHKQEIATQLDIDYAGSAYPYFDLDTLGSLKYEFCREPDHVGKLHVDPGCEPRFEEDDGGNLKLWIQLNADNEPPSDRDYVVGADISQGTGASESTLSVGDRLSGEKVAELASNTTPAHRWAEVAVALCRMFAGPGGRGAHLIWEATGPGRTFGRAIVDDLSYGNIYFARREDTLRKKVSDKPGWFSTGEGKKDLLANYRDSLFEREFINPSERAMDQCAEFVYLPNGKIEHGGAQLTIDPSDRGANHGDLVIADALVAKIIRERKVKPAPPVSGPPVMSFQWRRDQRVTDLATVGEWD